MTTTTTKKFSFFSSNEFAEAIPLSEANSTAEIELKPCLHIYHAASHYLLIAKSDDINDDDGRERLENLCRYLLVSIEAESPKLSYVAVALNKDHSLSWIRHIKKLLYKCCTLMDSLKPETHRDTVSLALVLRILIGFTCPNSWAILRSKQLSVMKPAMQQVCNNVLGFLIQKGFFLSLRVS
jgi:ubiquitin-protein ligase E3 B